jgi:hypothetical protein
VFYKPTKRSMTNPKAWPRYRFTDAAPTYDNARGGQHPSGAETFGHNVKGSGYTGAYRNNKTELPGDTDRRNLRNTLPGSDQTPTQWDAAATDPTVAGYEGPFSGGKENAGVTGEIRGTPGAGPTDGGAGPQGLHHLLLGRYEVDGNRYQYWIEHSPNATHVYRKDMQSNGSLPAEHVASFGRDDNSYIHGDQAAAHFRVWRTGRSNIDMSGPGITQGRRAASAVNDSARKIAAINEANRRAWNK